MKSKNYIRQASYLRNSIAYDHVFRSTFVKRFCFLVFFSFFQKLNFQVAKGIKGQKTTQNDK